MTIDIGGTSCDVSLVDRSELPRAENFEIEFGIPVKAPMVDIRTIGAGGGSIAWIDAGGLLRVGPQSAGSTPGPACYGQGGTEPTVTDANLVLGRLNADKFCGGEIPLQLEPRDQRDRAACHTARAVGRRRRARHHRAREPQHGRCSECHLRRAGDRPARLRARRVRRRGCATRGGDRRILGCRHGRRSSVPREHVRLRPADGGPAHRSIDDAAHPIRRPGPQSIGSTRARAAARARRSRRCCARDSQA